MADLRLLVPALVGWAAGALTLGAPVRPRVIAGSAGLVVVAALWVWRSRHRRRGGRHAAYQPGAGVSAFLLSTAAASAVVLAAALHQARSQEGQLLWLAHEAATVSAVGTVSGDPQPVRSRGDERAERVFVQVRVQSVQGRGRGSRAWGRIVVFGSSSWTSVRRGERVRFTGRLRPASPGEDVVATLAARGPPDRLAVASLVARVAEHVRAGLRTASTPLHPDARGLLPGLVVGDTSLQSADLQDDLRSTGLTHLSAVSGSNTTLVCALAFGLARVAGLGRRARVIGASLVLAGFVVLARPDPSVLRAAVMGAVGLLAVVGGRRRIATGALAAAVLSLLALDPWMARSYGFSLSVLATLGLVISAEPWSNALSRWLPRWVAVALVVPLVAQVWCAPVLVLLTPWVSLSSWPANVLAAPLVAPATVLGLAAAVFSPVSSELAEALARVAGIPCHGIALIARSFAGWSWSRVPWFPGAAGAGAMVVMLVAALGLLRWARSDVASPSATRQPWAGPDSVLTVGTEAVRAGGWAPRAGPRRRRIVLATVAAAAIAALAPLPHRLVRWSGAGWPGAGWAMVACDVGQGDALVLATAPGRAVLVDAGPDPRAIDSCLSRLAVRQLDAIVLTHFHADHVDGLLGALRGRRVGRIIVTIVDEPAAAARRVGALAARHRLPVERVVDGSTDTIGAVSWQVLWPARVVRDGSIANNASIVMLVRTRGVRLLLLGDIEPAAARQVADRLRRDQSGAHVDVLKVAHHGSGRQDASLLAIARPRLAVISVGAGNDYGHPASSVIRSLTASGAAIARTDQHGDVAIGVDSGRLVLVTARSGASARSPPGAG
ncbi:MAG: ComEC/Rec2 family competence protein [Angustibacter sp.]